MPAWFDEGLAVVVSDDLRYLRPDIITDRCLVEPALDLPVERFEWASRSAADHSLYTHAACRVLRWMKSHGGREAILALIRHIADGDSFVAAFTASSQAHGAK